MTHVTEDRSGSSDCYEVVSLVRRLVSRSMKHESIDRTSVVTVPAYRAPHQHSAPSSYPNYRPDGGGRREWVRLDALLKKTRTELCRA